MATVKFTYPHSLPIPEAKKRVDALMADSPNNFPIKSHWEGDKIIATGSGFEGSMNVTATGVDVEIKLGLAVSVFKGKIESSMKEGFDKHFKS